jgi:hypothetical protein
VHADIKASLVQVKAQRQCNLLAQLSLGASDKKTQQQHQQQQQQNNM